MLSANNGYKKGLVSLDTIVGYILMLYKNRNVTKRSLGEFGGMLTQETEVSERLYGLC